MTAVLLSPNRLSQKWEETAMTHDGHHHACALARHNQQHISASSKSPLVGSSRRCREYINMIPRILPAGCD